MPSFLSVLSTGGYKKRTAKVGDTIVVSIKKIRTNNTNKSKSKIKRFCKQSHCSSTKNGHLEKMVALFDSQKIRFNFECPKSTNRCSYSGIIPNELKRYKGARITSLASGIL